jgi:putative transposase
MVRRAEDWRWSSCRLRLEPVSSSNDDAALRGLMSEPPVELSRNWRAVVNAAQTPVEEAAVRTSITRSRPLGDERWRDKTVRRLKLEWTMRPRGRQVGWRKPK